MGFQIVEPGHWKAKPALEEGEVAINKEGRLTFRSEDLELARIEGFCVLLADPLTLRLALRKPRDGEAGRAVVVSKVKGHKGKETGRRHVNATRAIKALKLDPAACAGRHDLSSKDDLLIIALASVGFGDAGAEAK